ncbi:MAG: glycine betaine ABC transporter substrate-binding protein [Gemmatimonadota bacterium]
MKTFRRVLLAGALWAPLLGGLNTPVHAQTSPRAVIVASKPFGESYLLAEMFAQVLEARGLRVDRRPGLGATEIAFGALRDNRIDVFPEYTGTALVAILKQPPIADRQEAFRTVHREFSSRFGLLWLPPLGFENTYAIAVRRETAEKYHLKTLSDLARAAPLLTAGFTPDFIGRSDGLPGLARAYGFKPRQVRSLLQAVKYQALAEGSVDVIDGYSTDGRLAKYDLVVLEDERHFFPPYEAAAVLSSAIQRDVPGVAAALGELSGKLDVVTMRKLNERIEIDGEPIPDVARDALAGLGILRSDSTRAVSNVRVNGFFSYMWDRRGQILSLTGRHLVLVAVSLVAAILIAIPLGLLLERSRSSAEGVIRSVGLLQTVPSIALLAFMLPLLGIGLLPALFALFLYSLYPILRNTYSGVRDAAPAAVAAAEALGMTPHQVLRHVRLPLAAPIIMAGIRTAGVINVGTATLAAFIGAGGLGDPIVAGLALSDTRMILSGALPAALLALVVDLVLGSVERGLRIEGLK